MRKLLFSIITAGSLFAGNFINLQITNDTLMTEGQFNIAYEQPFYARGGFLLNSDKSNFYYVGIKSEGQAVGVDLPLKFSLILDFAHTKNNSAIPIGIGASGYLQQVSIPVFVRGEFEYAPKVLSFDDANKFVKFKIEMGTQFIENGEVFVGYRNISFENNYNSNVYGGIGFSF
jgi:hypothetical protein